MDIQVFLTVAAIVGVLIAVGAALYISRSRKDSQKSAAEVRSPVRPPPSVARSHPNGHRPARATYQERLHQERDDDLLEDVLTAAVVADVLLDQDDGYRSEPEPIHREEPTPRFEPSRVEYEQAPSYESSDSGSSDSGGGGSDD